MSSPTGTQFPTSPAREETPDVAAHERQEVHLSIHHAENSDLSVASLSSPLGPTPNRKYHRMGWAYRVGPSSTGPF
jgi:hypothetical protein